jgi:phage gp46-like protein
MSDLALRLQADGTIDLALTENGLDFATEDGLETAIILSLYLDRRAAADDTLPDGSANRRGSWMDDFQTPANYQLGSRLWLLAREKQLPDVLRRAKTYVEEALQWLIDDGIAHSVVCTPSWSTATVLAFSIVITGAATGTYQNTFLYSVETA